MQYTSIKSSTYLAAVFSMRNHISPGSAFAHPPLVVGLLVVQLVVGGVFTLGSGRDHGPGLIPIGRLGPGSAPRGCAKKGRTKGGLVMLV